MQKSKKLTILGLSSAICLFGMLLTTSCGGDKKTTTEEETDSAAAFTAEMDVEMKELTLYEGSFMHTYLVADQEDRRHIYKDDAKKEKCFFIISKKEYRLYVYEATAQDTALVATFPVCYAINPDAKQREGDNCTPECSMSNPFHIMELNDASTWCFDFNDGRGSIKAFGNHFMRLDLSKSFPDNEALATNRSIGIHGSTGNEVSVPGRDSHGCVRLLDSDLDYVFDHYAQVGTMVVIKGIHENKYDFEKAAVEKLGDTYHAPKKGNPELTKQSTKGEGQNSGRKVEDVEPSEGGATHASNE